MSSGVAIAALLTGCGSGAPKPLDIPSRNEAKPSVPVGYPDPTAAERAQNRRDARYLDVVRAPGPNRVVRTPIAYMNRWHGTSLDLGFLLKGRLLWPGVSVRAAGVGPAVPIPGSYGMTYGLGSWCYTKQIDPAGGRSHRRLQRLRYGQEIPVEVHWFGRSGPGARQTFHVRLRRGTEHLDRLLERAGCELIGEEGPIAKAGEHKRPRRPVTAATPKSCGNQDSLIAFHIISRYVSCAEAILIVHTWNDTVWQGGGNGTVLGLHCHDRPTGEESQLIRCIDKHRRVVRWTSQKI